MNNYGKVALTPSIRCRRSRFDMGYRVTTAFNNGLLVPVGSPIEVIPGDTFKIDVNAFIRMNNTINVPLDDIFCDIWVFFVPNRIVWTHWKDFCGENTSDPWTAPTTYRIPTIAMYNAAPNTWTTATPNSILAYFGIDNVRINDASGNKTESIINALPVRGYCSIWNFYFRDENYQYPILFQTGDSGVVYSTSVTSNHQSASVGNELLPLNRFHDMFSSCVPNPNKVDAAVRLPINSLMSDARFGFYNAGGIQTKNSTITNPASGSGTLSLNDTTSIGTTLTLKSLPIDALGTIDQFRLAYLTDQFYKRQATTGTRYPEFIKGTYGVTAPDYLLDEPLLLGHTRFAINLSPVVQTSASEDSTYDGSTIKQSKGSISGYSATRHDSSLTVHSFVEHGFLFVLTGTRTKRSYSQSMDKYFKKRDLLDIYNPIFAALGAMPVYTWQLSTYGNVLAGTGVSASNVFGYNEAWIEYRTKPNQVTGMMRQSGVYNTWTFCDVYDSIPTFSDSWLSEGITNLNRTLYVAGSSTVPQFLADFKVDVIATRPMPVHSVPGLDPYF